MKGQRRTELSKCEVGWQGEVVRVKGQKLRVKGVKGKSEGSRVEGERGK